MPRRHNDILTISRSLPFWAEAVLLRVPDLSDVAFFLPPPVPPLGSSPK
jgi:hypothetical protein